VHAQAIRLIRKMVKIVAMTDRDFIVAAEAVIDFVA
jgi:hypothetical protein